MALQIVLNGQTRSFDELQHNASVDDLVLVLGLKADRVALERNGAIVSRSVWKDTQLQESDRIELVHFVGGGTHP